ncbi:MAG: hypothetical protein HN368_16740 [Spirochaetales bacterium]|jgi:tagaturonate epimerase|nr:hypothetical protein [Spirochaetales bacterium]
MERLARIIEKNNLLVGYEEERIIDSGDTGVIVYPRSLKSSEGTLYFIAVIDGAKKLVLSSKAAVADSFSGDAGNINGMSIRVADLSWENYLHLKERFPFIEPVSLRTRRTTIGCGDRLGLATPGHLKACAGYDVTPVLAQQSIRELMLTGRTYKGVVSDAAFLVFQDGYTGGYGADGDHLKTIEDIDIALSAGMPMITLDLTEVMNPEPAEWSDSRIESEYVKLSEQTRKRIDADYCGKSFSVGSGSITISPIEAKRCALMYWSALDFSSKVDSHIRKRRGDAYDLEISIDETTAPTVPAHHLFIARELSRREVTVNSLAPRFIGEFQKGIDYIGDIPTFEEQFKTHCEISRENGNYKISIHSGSDKFSVYPIIGRHTDLRLHLKTAGTSWLEAIRTIVKADPDFYRVMHKKAYQHFGEATKLYHITADLGKIPALDRVKDSDLGNYLIQDESRQLLHITYGGLLHDKDVRDKFFSTLAVHENLHYKTVAAHIEKHVRLLVEF